MGDQERFKNKKCSGILLTNLEVLGNTINTVSGANWGIVTVSYKLFKRLRRCGFTRFIDCLSLFTASQVDGWNITVVNVSQSSITFQWPNLTDVLGNEVLAYVALVETISGEKASGNIVLLNVTSIRIDGLKGATEYRVFAVAVDVLGQPHRSSQVWTSTEEGGECSEVLFN